MTLASLTNGTQMFGNNTINTAWDSQVLIELGANNPNDNVTVPRWKTAKYNTTGEMARDLLVVRTWTITDAVFLNNG